MSRSQEMLTTRQFARQAGVSPTTVSKWLREGKIDGRKVGGKWNVPADQLDRVAEPASTAAKPADASASHVQGGASAPAAQAQSTQEVYSVEAFSAMTYLTASGVERWLKEGRLKGTRDENGQWRVAGANLMDRHIQRLLRR